jgi:4-methylaminobutanoate oxidase (formaldehyde-forming)
MKTDDIIDACYSPTDGHLQPAELVAAYASVGRSLGVRYETRCPIERIVVRGGRVEGVATSRGEFHAPVVVNATGPWSYIVAEKGDVSLPTAALGHYYLTTKPLADIPVDRRSPAVRDREHRIYSRPESGGLIVGMYEAEPDRYDMAKLGADFDMSAMRVARDKLNVALLIDAAGKRFPWITGRTPMTITTGIMTFTPDGKPLCGAQPDVEGLFHCAGFCGHGIVQSPVIGSIMADLIIDGRTKYAIAEIEADRFFDMPEYRDRARVERACYETYSGYYGRIEPGAR